MSLAPSTVSAHFAELRRAGLIVERKEGRWVHYGLVQSADVEGITSWRWPRIKRDPQLGSDRAVVKQLRKVPVADLCSADLNIDQLAIARAT